MVQTGSVLLVNVIILGKFKSPHQYHSSSITSNGHHTSILMVNPTRTFWNKMSDSIFRFYRCLVNCLIRWCIFPASHTGGDARFFLPLVLAQSGTETPETSLPLGVSSLVECMPCSGVVPKRSHLPVTLVVLLYGMPALLGLQSSSFPWWVFSLPSFQPNDLGQSSGEQRSYPTDVVVNFENNQAVHSPVDMSMEEEGSEEQVLLTHSSSLPPPPPPRHLCPWVRRPLGGCAIFRGQYLRSHLPATLVVLPYGTPYRMGLQFWSFERNVGVRRFIVLPRMKDSRLDHFHLFSWFYPGSRAGHHYASLLGGTCINFNPSGIGVACDPAWAAVWYAFHVWVAIFLIARWSLSP